MKGKIVQTTFQKVADNQTVVQKITNQLLQQLIDGKLLPGQRLPTEPEFAEQLGVGRNSLREAMKKLTALGIVTVRRGDGTFINAEPGSSSYEAMMYALITATATTEELLELREKTETDVLELAAAHCTETDILELENISDAYHQALREGNVDLAYELDISFHMRIAEAGRNRLMTRMFKTALTMFTSSIRSSLWPDLKEKHWVNRSHLAMIDAMRRRAVAECAEIVHRSISGWAGYLERAREAAQGVTPGAAPSTVPVGK